MSTLPRLEDLLNDLPLDSEEESTVVPPPEPVSPATPPSAGSGGEDLPRLDDLLEDPGLRGAQNYGGETWRELGIKLPDNLKKDLGGEDSVIPKAEVEKGMEIPTFWNEGKWGHAGKMAFDMVALRDKAANARIGAWTRQFKADNGRVPTQEEYNTKYIELAEQANDEIYALAEKVRGGRASALPGSRGLDRKFLWFDSDPQGKLYGGGLGVSTAKQEDRGFLSRIFSPFIVSMAGAEHQLLVEDVDEKGNIKQNFIEAPYNESHFLGWLDWLGRQSIFSYASTAAVAGQSEDPDSWAAGSGGGALALINPVNYWRGWGSDKHLQLLSRGEDIVSLREELNLRKLNATSYLLDGAESMGLISPETNKTGQNLTEFLTAFGLAIVDPDVFSLMTFGAGKIAKLQKVGKIGDALKISSKAHAIRRMDRAEEAAEQLANLALSGERDTFALSNDVDKILGSVDHEQQQIALNIARAMIASDPKASKGTEAIIEGRLAKGTPRGEVRSKAQAAQRYGQEAVGKITSRVEGEQTSTLKAARKKQETLKAKDTAELRAARKGKKGVVTARKIGNDIEAYKKAQLDDMWAASQLSDLRTQKRIVSRLKDMTRASKGVERSDEAIHTALKESAEKIHAARKKMQEAFMETPKPRGGRHPGAGPQTKNYAEAQREYNLATSQFRRAAMEASTKAGNDTERFLDELIAGATETQKNTAKRLADTTAKINARGTFKVNPKEHTKLVNGLLKNAPHALEERALISALSVAFKEQAAAYKKLGDFIGETPEARSAFSWTRSGGVSRAAELYRKAHPERADDLDMSPLASAALRKENLADFKYTGFKGIKDRADLRDKLVELRTSKNVAEWLSENAESPVYREIAKKVAKALPDDPNSRVVVVDNAWLRKKKLGGSLEELGNASDDVIAGRALGTSSYRWSIAGHVGSPTVSLKAHDSMMTGLTAETILHELLHAATQEKILSYTLLGTKGQPKGTGLPSDLYAEIKKLEGLGESIVPKIDIAIQEMVHRALQKAELGNRKAKAFETGWAHESLELMEKLRRSEYGSEYAEELSGPMYTINRWVVGRTSRPKRSSLERKQGYPRKPKQPRDAGGIWWDSSEAWNKLIVDKTESPAEALKRRHVFDHALRGTPDRPGLWGARKALRQMIREGQNRTAHVEALRDQGIPVGRGLGQPADAFKSVEPTLIALHNVVSGKIENLQEVLKSFDEAADLHRIGGIVAGRTPPAPLREALGRPNLHELVAYGLTDPTFIKFLQNTRSGDKVDKVAPTLWTSFVSTIAKLLGIETKHSTTLSELLSVTERIMEIPLDPALVSKARGGDAPALSRMAADGDSFFSESAFREAAGKTDGNSRSVLVYLSPEEFLGLAKKAESSPYKERRVAEAMAKGEKFSDIPFLRMDDTGKITGHEGRHRMRALQSAGVRKVPVILTSDNIRWISQDPRYKGSFDYKDTIPKKLVGEDGGYSIDIPIHTEGPNRGKVIHEAGEFISRLAADVPTTTAEARKASDMYMIEQVELYSGWAAKGAKYGQLGRTFNFIQKGLEDLWNPAQRLLGPAADEVHQIGIAMFGQVRKMQEDIVKRVHPAVEKAGQEALKSAEEAGKFAGKEGDELQRARDSVVAEAEAKVVSSYITSSKSIGGSLINTVFGERSLWDVAKPMLRASSGMGDLNNAEMAFNTLYKMWLPEGTEISPAIEKYLGGAAENLLKYGIADPQLTGKSVEELAALRQAGDNITFEEFSEGMRNATKSNPHIKAGGGAGGADSNIVRVNYFAAQAVTQMALMNMASTRINKVLADFPQESIEAAVRLASGDSLNPGQDMVEAMQVLNKLKVPGPLRKAATAANRHLEVGLKLYSDGDGFKAIVPRTWIDKSSELLGKIEKTANAAEHKITNPWELQGVKTYQGIYRLWHTAILTGLFIPRAAYFTNIYIGNFSQIVASPAGFRGGARFIGESAKDIFLWAPQALAKQTPLGKYVDEAMDRMAAKFPGQEFTLASPTNALINKHISEMMDPGLGDASRKIIGKGGEEFTLGGLRRSAVEQGIYTSFVSGSGLSNLMLRTNPGFGKKFWEKLTSGGPMAKLYADFANTLEQRQRVGLFTDLVVNKGMTPEEAGKITRDALYDWEAPMTYWETKFAKNVFMFYNFTRRAMGQAMRILLEPYTKAADDTLAEGFLRSSPVLAAATGKPAYAMANVMALEKARRETHEYMSDEETAAEYPWWAKKAKNKMFLPNTPMGAERSNSYSQTLGRDVDYKVMTMPSFTPVEMINQWGDIARILGAYGVASAEDATAYIIGDPRRSQVGTGDTLKALFEKFAEQGGPVSEDAMKGIMAGWTNDEQSYLLGGVNVTRLSDRKILEWLSQVAPFMDGLSWEDKKNPGMVRTDPTTMALLRGVPGISNEINTVFGPFLDVSAEGGEVGEALKEFLMSYLNFKTYRYSPEQVREWDEKEIKTRMGVRINEAKRKMPIGTAERERAGSVPSEDMGGSEDFGDLPSLDDLLK